MTQAQSPGDAAESGRKSPDSVSVRCRAITKSFGEGEARVQALRGVDIEIGAGETTLLVGPSGCGKTTLISVIAGILRRDEGECSVFGTDLTRLSERELTAWRGRNVGFVFQSFNLVPTLSVAHNVALPLLILGEGFASALRKADDLLARVGLEGRGDALPAKLSGGQQQRVAIARSVVHEPRLLVCDEPTSALDAESGQRVMQLLSEVARRPDRALLVVTHDSRILAFADLIVHMDDGRVHDAVRPKAVMEVA
ncbi:MAG: ABC transporter ATP-binding protein [Planctomycetes bacterium]|nr:ABC transporter ATP-binding protein [Planctomycetota bacterium]